jgi:hypothetical protein
MRFIVVLSFIVGCNSGQTETTGGKPPSAPPAASSAPEVAASNIPPPVVSPSASTPAPSGSWTTTQAAADLDAACSKKIEATVTMNLAMKSKDSLSVEFSKPRTPAEMAKLGLTASDATHGTGTLTNDQTIKLCKDPTVKWVAHLVTGMELKPAQ